MTSPSPFGDARCLGVGDCIARPHSRRRHHGGHVDRLSGCRHGPTKSGTGTDRIRQDSSSPLGVPSTRRRDVDVPSPEPSRCERPRSASRTSAPTPVRVGAASSRPIRLDPKGEAPTSSGEVGRGLFPVSNSPQMCPTAGCISTQTRRVSHRTLRRPPRRYRGCSGMTGDLPLRSPVGPRG